MQRIIVAADLHLQGRNPEELEIDQRLMHDILELAKVHDVHDIIILGDMLDSKNKPPLELMLFLKRFFHKYREQAKWHLIRGNHETPNNSHHNSWLALLEGDAKIVSEKPSVLGFKDMSVVMIPWDTPGTYRRNLESAMNLVEPEKTHKVLLSHVGLREGYLSPGVQAKEAQIGIRDLVPDFWAKVVLGDYHTAQQLANGKIEYVGTPIPRRQGETANGIMMIEVDADGNLSTQRLRLRTAYPEYKTWEGIEKAGPLQGYDSRNRNVIKVPVHLVDSMKRLYPCAKVIGVGDAVVTPSHRLENVDDGNPMNVLRSYLDALDVPKEEKKIYKMLGVHYLRKALAEGP